MTINKWLENGLLNGTIKEDDVIAIYDKNNNLEYLGKADFAPLNLWDEFNTCERVGNEWHVNERRETLPVCYVEVKELGKRKYTHVATMVCNEKRATDFVKECKTNALKMYGKKYVYQITMIYDDNRKEVVTI